MRGVARNVCEGLFGRLSLRRKSAIACVRYVLEVLIAGIVEYIGIQEHDAGDVNAGTLAKIGV